MKLKEKVRKFPQKPGVYLIRAEGEVIYVGKSRKLRDRVLSYFGSLKGQSEKNRALIREMDDVDYIVTDSEVEAFILEDDLIKEYMPRYNIQLKYNQRYPYVKLTDQKFPQLSVSRQIDDPDAEYFGPYTDVGALRETMETLEKLFPLRNCNWEYSKGKRRPCLRYYMGRCLGPCAGQVTEEEYAQAVEKTKSILKGDKEEIIARLRGKMERAAEEQNYEGAAKWRDKIEALKKLGGKQKVKLKDGEDQDFIALKEEGEQGILQIFFVRGGAVKGQESFELDLPVGAEREEALGAFIRDFYKESSTVPGTIHLSQLPQEVETIENWLSEIRGSSVALNVPQRGQKKELLDLARRNAGFTLDNLVKEEGSARKEAAPRSEKALNQLRDELDLENKPRHIEGYDISNISGQDAVGSMVVFKDGRPSKSDYRKFKIKRKNGPDDYGMLKEILQRRLAHLRKEEEKGAFRKRPDLLLIDGGKGQLGATREALEEMGEAELPVVGLAKEFERVFTGDGPRLPLAEDSPALHLLQRIRDEAHRFAVSYHRKLRQQRTIRSSLDAIEGVGPKRKKLLLRKFGSIQAVKEASLEELEEIPRLPHKVAKRIKDFWE